MRAYKLGNSHAKVLDRLVAEGVFKSPEAALRDAVDTYLSGLRQRQQQAGFAIDLYPADDGAYKTQEQWIAFFNEQRKPMISAANLYLAGKSAPDELLKSLRSDFDESLIVSLSGLDDVIINGLVPINMNLYPSLLTFPALSSHLK